MKEKVYQNCVKLAMLHRSETWCLREREVELSRRTKRAMCGVKLIGLKITKELLQLYFIKDW